MVLWALAIGLILAAIVSIAGRNGWYFVCALVTLPMSLYLTATPRGLWPGVGLILLFAALAFPVVRRRRNAGWFLLAPVFGLMAILGYLQWESSQLDPHFLPPLPPRVAAGSVAIPAVDNTYCSSGLQGTGCGYGYTSPRIVELKGLKPTPVPPGSHLKIDFDRKPLSYTVHQWVGDRPIKADLGPAGTVTVPASSGAYTYSVEARWLEGSASYTFFVEVL
jgi:hypothetical protein